MTLEELRTQIDTLDDRLLRLLTERAQLALQVGQVKKRDGKRVFDPERERAVLKRMIDANRGPLPAGAVKKIFHEIVRQHRRLAQRATLSE